MRKIVLLLTTLITLYACSNKQVEMVKVNPKFTAHIMAFTSGMISNQSEIRVQFQNDVKGVEINQKLNNTLISFTPEIKGSSFWADNRTLVFKPDTLLPPNQLYKAQLPLNFIADIEKELSVFEFNFQTKPLFLTLLNNGITPYQNDEMQWQKLSGKIISSDYVSPDLIAQCLKIDELSGKLKWTSNFSGTTHEFVLDSIERKAKAQSFYFNLSGKSLGTDQLLELPGEIPALGDFKLMQKHAIQGKEQYVSLIFSDPVHLTQDINGLIYAKNGTAVNLVKNGNEVKVYPTSRINGEIVIVIDRAITNVAGYQIQESYETPISFSSILPAVELIGEGTIVPFSNGVQFPFKAVNLQAVTMRVLKVYENNALQFFQDNTYDGHSRMKRVARLVLKKDIQLNTGKPIDLGTWNTFSIDLSDHMTIESGCVYRIQLSFQPSQSLYPCSGENVSMDENHNFLNYNEEDAFYDQADSYWSYYGSPFLTNYNGYEWEDRDNPCTPSYYMVEDRRVSKNILASNLGIIAKGNDRFEYSVFVTDLNSAATKSGVKVQMYNYQQQVMATATTDGEGKATFQLKGKPFICVASQDGQKGYLKVADGNALSTSMFNVDGTKDQFGIKAYIYGERGVWRPGDSLFISCVIQDLENVLPNKHPIIFELKDPRGNVKQRIVQNYTPAQILTFKTLTDMEDETGNWTAKVKIGGMQFSKSLKIENIKPNRLKIKVDFDQELLVANQVQTAQIKLNWLHGAVAKNLRTDVEMRLYSGSTKFEKFPDFSFDDASKYFSSSEEIIYDGLVNQAGVSSFNTNIQVQNNAPGMLKAKFKVRAFEKGGDFSIAQFTKQISPYNEYVGVKVPEGNGWRGALSTDEENIITLTNVNKDGEAVTGRKVKVEVFRLGWRWWWERNQDDYLAHYVNNASQYLIYSAEVDVNKAETLHELKFDRNHWGRAYVRVSNPITGHAAGKAIYLDYSSWWNDPNGEKPGGAEMLNFDVEKEGYKVGEEVTLSFPSHNKGRALVSLESGSDIVETFWVDCQEGNTKVSFKATPEMVPNIYVNIAFIQPHQESNNDLPLRMYGLSSINIEDPATKLSPEIIMPDVLAPEKEVKITVKEKNGEKMSVTLAVVDEGILDLTNFKTPNPHQHFYRKEALGVRSWDMFKHVMGAFNGEFSALLALGGDETLSGDSKNKVNRFKPVVKFFGPFEVEANESKTISFVMPNYIGAVRTYVVASNDKAYGNAEKSTPVRKPLMALTTLPRVLGPGEKVNVPVTVFAMDEKIKNVKVSIQPNDLFQVVGENSKNITFTETGDQIVNFLVEVKQKIGVGEIETIVQSGKIITKEKVSLNVRIANPNITQTEQFMINGDDEVSSNFKAIGVKGSNELIVEVSSLPPLNLKDRLKYLVRYPHGCVEQTTSSVFPQLYLTELLDLNNEEISEIKGHIIAGIERLSNFQQANGGLSYWPSYYHNVNDWGTTYAGHFMMEAEKLGYSLPIGFKDKWVEYQTKTANTWSNSDYKYSHYSQAYRLYTLALAGRPAMGAMNRLKQSNHLNHLSKWRLAAAYAMSGKTEIAAKMISELSYEVENYREVSYNFGSSLRDQAMILETLVIIGKEKEGFSLIKEMSAVLSSNAWLNTQETAYSLISIGKFVQAFNIQKDIHVMLKINDELVEVDSKLPVYQYKVDEKHIKDGTINIRNIGKNAVFATVINSGTPLENAISTQSNDLNMTVTYKDMAGNIMDVSQIKQGTDFKAIVTLTKPNYRGYYKDMALSHIFPSGWEIRNMRFEENESNNTGIDYQDIKDDRVYSYFNIDYGQQITVEVILHAAYAGTYYLPAVYAESMYDNTINAVEAGQWTKVIAVE